MILANFGGKVAEYRKVNLTARIKDSIEAYGMDRRTYTEQTEPDVGFDSSVRSVPDVWRYRPASTVGKPDFVRMTERVQHWIFRCNVEVYLGRRFTDAQYKSFWEQELAKHKVGNSFFIRTFTSLFTSDRSHTNKAGFGDKFGVTSRNYIAQEDLSADYPKLFHIVTGGFVGKLVSRNARMIAGESCLPFECINISLGDFEQYHPFTHPHLFDTPKVTGRDLVYTKGGWQITGYWRLPFHHFNYQAVIPFTLPVDGVAWYPARLMG